MAQDQSQAQAQFYTRVQAQFQSLLQSLGEFVHTLTHVYPHAKNLETIEQTCPHLKEIEFVLRDKGAPDKTALTRFLMRMTDLEMVAFDAQTEMQTSNMLHILASYACPGSSSSDRVVVLPQRVAPAQISSEATSTNATCAHGQLRKLEIKHMVHSTRMPTMQWERLEAVLANHPYMKHIVLRDCCLQRASDAQDNSSWSLRSWPPLLGRLSTVWNKLSSAHSSEKRNGNIIDGNMRENDPCRPPEAEMFSHLESLYLIGVQFSEELLCSILMRCPALQSLSLSPVGSVISLQTWPQWLPHCRRLRSFSINGSTGVSLGISVFWSLAPSTLTSFKVSYDQVVPLHSHEQSAYFFLPGHQQPGQSQQNQQNLDLIQPRVQDTYAILTGQGDLSNHIPGSTLVTLHLDIGIRVADRGLRYLMANCRSLRSLVLGIQYFSEWEMASSSAHFEESTLSTAFPPWACAGSLKELEFRAVYWRHDSQMDMRMHAFIRRLADLKVLRRLIMPMKLVSDLSESLHQEYAAFRLMLDQLDHSVMLQEQAQVQYAFATSSSNITTTTPCTTMKEFALGLQSSHSATQLQQEKQQQQHQSMKHAEEIWKRDGSGPVNFFPQMASVRKVTLSSGTRVGRVQMQMRYLHILMEAMPGLVTIQTGTEMYGVNFQSGFKQIQNRFMEMYGNMGVRLTMGFSMHSRFINTD
ncbi:hypothetical protein BGZ51_009483 [Haplosporangium sp. Z 767]|nr:hypothetical protein BGZ51_009483 [Haplosporangium sp. Z 767]